MQGVQDGVESAPGEQLSSTDPHQASEQEPHEASQPAEVPPFTPLYLFLDFRYSSLKT